MSKQILLLTIVCLLALNVLADEHNREDHQAHHHAHADDGTELHDTGYDHDSFLGKDGAAEFEKLSPEESRSRLRILVSQSVDTDKDGFVSSEELNKWIQYMSQKYLTEGRDRQWRQLQLGDDDLLTEEMYKSFTKQDPADPTSEEDKVKRDARRWKAADANGDGKLSKDEFMDFLHPEENPKLKHVHIEETMEYIDKDKDGKISEQEYIDDMWRPDSTDQTEPDWIATERRHFRDTRDTNKDGYLTGEEIETFLIPNDFNNVDSETSHLMQMADTNKDGMLSIDEIMENHDMFAGSQATDYGEALTSSRLSGDL